MNLPLDNERFRAIARPFVLLEQVIQARKQKPHLDWRSALALIATLAFQVVFLLVAAGSEVRYFSWIGVTAWLAGGFFLLFFLARSVRYYLRKKGLPSLAEELRSLQPARAELEELYDYMEGRFYVLIDYVSLEEIQGLVSSSEPPRHDSV